MSRIFALLLIFSIALPKLVISCSCPDVTSQELYQHANVVLRARAVAVKRLEPTAPLFAVSYLFKLRTIRTFKGCSPGKFFYAKTYLDGGTCSTVLKKGDNVRLLLPVSPETSATFPRRFYEFIGCDDAQSWEYVSKADRAFLRSESKKPQNRCMNTKS